MTVLAGSISLGSAAHAPSPGIPVTSPPMRRILFVDDELQVLQGLQNSLHKQRRKWHMVFVSTGEAALAALDAAPFDLVVSDMRMPGMDGATLLEQVRDRHPRAARIVLSGQADRDAILRTVTVAHQFLSKPCDPETLRGTIERVCGLSALAHHDAVRSMVGEVRNLPSLPRVHRELTDAINADDASASKIAEIVELDPALSTKVLQLVNSAFFGIPRKTVSVRSAVAYLGVELIRTLSLAAHVFGDLVSDVGQAELIDDIQQRAIAQARVAKRLASNRQVAEQAFTASLVQDVGILLTALRAPERTASCTARMKATGLPWHVVEAELGAPNHAEVGAYLLGSWGLPFELVEAVAYHHLPSSAPAGCPLDLLGVVHAADAIVGAIAAGETDPMHGIDVEFAARAGLGEKMAGWRVIAEDELKRNESKRL